MIFLFCFPVAALSQIEFVEIDAKEIVFWKNIPLKWQSHPAIKDHIEANAGIKFQMTRIPMWRMEKKKEKSTFGSS